MNGSEPRMTIGQVAARVGIRLSRIRYYEAIGVLPEPERVSGQRRYDEDLLHRLSIIDVAQRAGLTLDEIRELTGPRVSDESAGQLLRELAQFARVDQLRPAVRSAGSNAPPGQLTIDPDPEADRPVLETLVAGEQRCGGHLMRIALVDGAAGPELRYWSDDLAHDPLLAKVAQHFDAAGLADPVRGSLAAVRGRATPRRRQRGEVTRHVPAGRASLATPWRWPESSPSPARPACWRRSAPVSCCRPRRASRTRPMSASRSPGRVPTRSTARGADHLHSWGGTQSSSAIWVAARVAPSVSTGR